VHLAQDRPRGAGPGKRASPKSPAMYRSEPQRAPKRILCATRRRA